MRLLDDRFAEKETRPMNVPEPTSVVEFDAALRGLAAQAATRYPGEQDRLGRGLVLALNGHVTLHEDGTASVRSGRDAEVTYQITHGLCDCRDAASAPDGRCKHLWSAALMRRALHGLTPLETALESVPEQEPETPVTYTTEQYEPAPVIEEDTLVPFLPEAGASLNIKVKAGQFEVQYTMRAHDDASVLSRLPAVVETLENLLPTGEEDGLLLRLLHAFFPQTARMR